MQLAGNYQAISAIVAFAAHQRDAASLRILLEDELGDRGAGIVHQGQRRHTVASSGGAIDLAHLGCGSDLHAELVAESSNCRNPLSSPIAIKWSPTRITSSGAG